MTYGQFLLALCLWREARGQSAACMAGIAAVIRNRAEDPKKRWPRTVSGVILEPRQFSSFNVGDPNAVKFPVEPAISTTTPAFTEWNAWLQACDVATVPLTADPTQGATNYESLPADAEKPAWCDPAKLTTTIGPFRFYRL